MKYISFFLFQAKKFRESVTNFCCDKFRSSLKASDNSQLQVLIKILYIFLKDGLFKLEIFIFQNCLASFLLVVSENRLRLSPFGFFNVGMDLVITVSFNCIFYYFNSRNYFIN